MYGESDGLIIYSHQRHLIPFVPPSHATPDPNLFIELVLYVLGGWDGLVM